MGRAEADFLEAAATRCPLAINAALVRAEVVARYGGFDENLRALEDWELWLRYALAGACFAFHDAPEAKALVRVHAGSLSSSHRRMAQSFLLFHEKLVQSKAPPQIIRRHASWQLENRAAWALHEARSGHLGCAQRLLRENFRSDRNGRWLAWLLAAPLLAPLSRWQWLRSRRQRRLAQLR
jgi:hypothetical protein